MSAPHRIAHTIFSTSSSPARRMTWSGLCQCRCRRWGPAWSVDRLGRSLTDLLGFLTDLHAKGVDLFLHQQGLDTSTPSGRAMFQMLGVFAEFERAMIRERVMTGLARARVEGKQLGRRTVEQREPREVLAQFWLHRGRSSVTTTPPCSKRHLREWTILTASTTLRTCA